MKITERFLFQFDARKERNSIKYGCNKGTHSSHINIIYKHTQCNFLELMLFFLF